MIIYLLFWTNSIEHSYFSYIYSTTLTQALLLCSDLNSAYLFICLLKQLTKTYHAVYRWLTTWDVMITVSYWKHHTVFPIIEYFCMFNKQTGIYFTMVFTDWFKFSIKIITLFYNVHRINKYGTVLKSVLDTQNSCIVV